MSDTLLPKRRIAPDEFNADIAAANDQQMFGNLVEFERFDMRQRLSLSKPGNGFQPGSRARADDHVRAAHPASPSV